MASSQLPLDLPPQLPFLLERHDDEHLRAYSPISSQAQTIHCPRARAKSLYGPSYGYVHSTNSDPDSDPGPTSPPVLHSLLNPLTNEELTVQFETGFSGSLVSMSPHIMAKGNYLVFKSHHNPQKLGFYQPCNRDWRYVDLPITDFTGFYLGNACLNGFFIMVQNDSGTTLVVDIASCSSFSVPPPDDIRKVYFVESGGKILRVAKRVDGASESSDSSHSNFCFEIYQLDAIDDTNGGGYRWVKSTSIGDQVLFLDWHGGISVAASENTGLRGNSIYFLQMCYDGTVPFLPEFELHWYNIADGQSEKIPSRFNIQSNWFVPRTNGYSSLQVGP